MLSSRGGGGRRLAGWPVKTVLVRGARGVVAVDYANGVSMFEGDSQVPSWGDGIGRTRNARVAFSAQLCRFD